MSGFDAVKWLNAYHAQRGQLLGAAPPWLVAIVSAAHRAALLRGAEIARAKDGHRHCEHNTEYFDGREDAALAIEAEANKEVPRG
jgi:hypothetical protein